MRFIIIFGTRTSGPGPRGRMLVRTLRPLRGGQTLAEGSAATEEQGGGFLQRLCLHAPNFCFCSPNLPFPLVLQRRNLLEGQETQKVTSFLSNEPAPQDKCTCTWHPYICIHTRAHAHRHPYIYICNVHTHMHVQCTWIPIYMGVHIYKHTHRHPYTHASTYTHAHTHKLL